MSTLLIPNEYLTIPFIQTYGSLGTNYVDKERWVGQLFVNVCKVENVKIGVGGRWS